MEVEWVLPQMAALSGGELPAKMEAHSSPEAEGKEDSFIPAFEFRSSSFFFFMANSHTTLAKNREAWGSSRWCRACRGKTWETCNPEADLESGTSKQDISGTVANHPSESQFCIELTA